ncbi:hypothetical protein [Pseudomonas syringae]|uniref:hypothetical protein n=1 Tax=Pseudomonas syringae TaxID=317 RepID=UPI0013E91FF2|nr:hypothetical protein [Pseudomonas syringae]
MNAIHIKTPVANLLDEINFEVMANVPAYKRKGLKVDHADLQISIHKVSAQQHHAVRVG